MSKSSRTSSIVEMNDSFVPYTKHDNMDVKKSLLEKVEKDKEEEKLLEDDDSKFKEYPYRWVIVVIFILYTLANAAYTVSFAPIAT
jgi:hypothetical protein